MLLPLLSQTWLFPSFDSFTRDTISIDSHDQFLLTRTCMQDDPSICVTRTIRSKHDPSQTGETIYLCVCVLTHSIRTGDTWHWYKPRVCMTYFIVRVCVTCDDEVCSLYQCYHLWCIRWRWSISLPHMMQTLTMNYFIITCDEVQPIPLGVTFSNATSKAQSSKLERLFSLKHGKRDIRAWSFELSKMSPQVGLAVLHYLIWCKHWRWSTSSSHVMHTLSKSICVCVTLCVCDTLHPYTWRIRWQTFKCVCNTLRPNMWHMRYSLQNNTKQIE